jgi:hypothetical protein
MFQTVYIAESAVPGNNQLVLYSFYLKSIGYTNLVVKFIRYRFLIGYFM